MRSGRGWGGKTSVESFFSLTGRYGAGSPLLGTRGRAGAAHPSLTSCQRRTRAAARPCAGPCAWCGDACRRSKSALSSCTPLQAPHCCECHTTYGSRQSGGHSVLVAGGSAPEQQFCALLQRRREHRLLPPPLLQLAGATQCVPRCAHQMLSCTVRFDSWTYRRLPHIR